MQIEAISWNLRSLDWKAGASQMMVAAVAGASAAMMGALFQKTVFPPLLDNADRVEIPRMQEVVGKCKRELTQAPCVCPLQPEGAGISLYLLLPLLVAVFLGHRLGQSRKSDGSGQALKSSLVDKHVSSNSSGRAVCSEKTTSDNLLRFGDREVVSALSFERDHLASLIQKKKKEAILNEKLIDAFSRLWYDRHREGGWFIQVSTIVSRLQERFSSCFSKHLEHILESNPDWWIEGSEEKLFRTSFLPDLIVELSRVLEISDSDILKLSEESVFGKAGAWSLSQRSNAEAAQPE